MRLRALSLVIAGLFVATGAFAQTEKPAEKPGDGGCVLDNCADKKPVPAASPAAESRADRTRPRGPSIPGQFDFYVLSLSWSPGFCETTGAEKHRKQCDPGSGLGFVVHGLWPQYESGFPSDCGPAGRSPSRNALQSAEGVYPDINLARYEWRRHGTCSGKSPSDYFADVRRARDAVEIPPPFRSASDRQTWTPVDIERAFIASNPNLKPDMMAVSCRRGVLEAVRFCLTKDLREFRSCPEVSGSSCRTRELRVPAPL